MTELQNIKEDEIDLLDLLKVIIKNRKIIIITWVIVLILGISFGIYKKNTKSFMADKKFTIRALESQDKENSLTMDPVSFYENQNFIDKFFQIDLVKKKTEKMMGMDALAQKNFIKSIFDLKKENNNYVLKITGKNVEEVRKMEKIYFEVLQKYLKDNFGSILLKDLELQKKNSDSFKKELIILERQINDLAKNNKEHYNTEDLKELYPTIFAEKDSVALVYSENYKELKIIENNIAKLNDLVVYQSTLNKVEDKMSIKLIFVISNVLGVFLGVFVVFMKEFFKGINWKELKEISKIRE